MKIATTDGNSHKNEIGGNRESIDGDRLNARSFALSISIYLFVSLFISISLSLSMHANVYRPNPSARLNPIGNARYSPCRPRTAGRSGL